MTDSRFFTKDLSPPWKIPKGLFCLLKFIYNSNVKVVRKFRIFEKMRGLITNIEKETLENELYRKVLFTANYSQLVLMNLKPREEIGEEVHGLDQFFRFESGIGKVVLNGEEAEVSDGFAVVVPAGTRHNIINTSPDKPLKLYTIYSPPNHQDGTIHATKAEEVEEHFDGKVSF